MTKIRLNYIHEFSDRHGKVRRYVRLPGGKRIPLRGAPGTDEFMDGYRAALASDAPRVEIGASRTKPGTVNAAVVGYFGSTAFLSLAPSTRTTYRGIIDAFRAEHGDKRIAMLERRHITRIVAEKSATPSAANNLLKMLRMLTQFAIAEEMRRDDPTLGIKGIKLNNDGFYTWSEGDYRCL